MENQNAKKYFWIFLDILLVGIIINLFFFVMPMFDQIGNSRFPSRTFTVSAEGKTVAKPDIAQFSFSIVTSGPDLEKVAKENNERLAQAIDYVKGEGVGADDIKTTQYNLYPKYEYDETRRVSHISGYELTQSVLVKIKNLEENLGKVSKILGGLPELGVNQVSGVSFSVEDPEELLAKARKEAFEKAKTKAKEMAKSSGVSLGKVVSFNDYQGGPIPYYSEYAYGMGGDSMKLAAPSVAPIEPGTEEITVNVSVTYEIR